jgi:hypothetical protein
MGGSELMIVSDNTTGYAVQGHENRITLRLTSQQTRNFVRAGWLTIGLGASSHMLNLNDTEAMMRVLELCRTHETDPLQSTR